MCSSFGMISLPSSLFISISPHNPPPKPGDPHISPGRCYFAISDDVIDDHDLEIIDDDDELPPPLKNSPSRILTRQPDDGISRKGTGRGRGSRRGGVRGEARQGRRRDEERSRASALRQDIRQDLEIAREGVFNRRGNKSKRVTGSSASRASTPPCAPANMTPLDRA